MSDLSASELARLLAAKRVPRQKNCARESCGKAFTTQGRGLYCCPTCRELAYRARKRQKTLDAPVD